MGVDVYMFVEYWSRTDDDPVWGVVDDADAVVTGEPGIESLTEGSFQIFRDRDLFGALAGVRGRDDPLFPPRGLPPLVSYAVGDLALSRIIEDDAPTNEQLHGSRRSSAVESVAKGWAQYGGLKGQKPYGWVTDGIREGSWLYLREIDAALAHHGLAVERCNYQFVAVMAAMRMLEARLGPDRTRVVFWFY